MDRRQGEGGRAPLARVSRVGRLGASLGAPACTGATASPADPPSHARAAPRRPCSPPASRALRWERHHVERIVLECYGRGVGWSRGSGRRRDHRSGARGCEAGAARRDPASARRVQQMLRRRIVFRRPRRVARGCTVTGGHPGSTKVILAPASCLYSRGVRTLQIRPPSGSSCILESGGVGPSRLLDPPTPQGGPYQNEASWGNAGGESPCCQLQM